MVVFGWEGSGDVSCSRAIYKCDGSVGGDGCKWEPVALRLAVEKGVARYVRWGDFWGRLDQ